MPSAVHRLLVLATPPLTGPDVKVLQRGVNRSFKHLRINRSITVDGEFGAQTAAAARQVAVCLGATPLAVGKLRRGVVTINVQKLVRGDRKPTRIESAFAAKRVAYRRKFRQRFALSPGRLAIARSKKLVGVHEEPAGSNWGPEVSEFILFTGYSGPVYWCGCFACWVVVKLGGAKIPERIRLGYAPYITADAKAGRNGLTAVPVADAQPGDLGCLWGGEHVVVVRGRPINGMVPTREGNTSSSDGSQSNGGEVADHERPIGDFDEGIVARWGTR